MRIELIKEVNEEYYLLNSFSASITPIFVLKESRSGETVETDSGRRYRVDVKSHKVFKEYHFALLGRMQILEQTNDAEYDCLLKKAGLKIVDRQQLE